MPRSIVTSCSLTPVADETADRYARNIAQREADRAGQHVVLWTEQSPGLYAQLHVAPRFAPFRNWEGLLEHARNGHMLFYWAPLDTHPVRVSVVKVFRNGKVRFRADGAYTVDSSHLHRFYRAV